MFVLSLVVIGLCAVIAAMGAVALACFIVMDRHMGAFLRILGWLIVLLALAYVAVSTAYFVLILTGEIS